MLLVVSLVGCSGDSDHKDLHTYIKKVNAREADKIETIPEIKPSPKYVKPAGDIYSTGAVLYFILTGGRFVYKEFYTDKDPILVILEGNLTPITHWNKDIPSELWDIIKKSLFYESKKRFETAGEFASTLRAYLN